jgi:methionyl-tRNA synthetase
VAKSKKKASKKSKAKKARKAAPARATKKPATKKRAAKSKRSVKKAGKTAKKGVKKASKKVVKKAAKKAGKKVTKKVAKKAAKKTVAKKAVAIATPVVVETSKPKNPKPRAPKTIAPSSVKAAAPAPKPVAAAAAERNTYFITTAIAYPNGQPHIGHAYEAIATDALARFQRLDGKDVFFLTGTDEHGQKMIQTAAAEGMSVSDLATRNAGRFRDMDLRLNVSFDRFIRTTEPAHHRSVQQVWNRMRQNGDIYIDAYSGWYSVRDEAYYAEDETVVGEDNVRRGPQGSPVEWVEEKSYFFKLSAYQDRLLALYKNQPDFIGPDSRRNEVISFVKGGLKDLSISRTTFDWGVKVPNDPEHVMYVWVDALGKPTPVM